MATSADLHRRRGAAVAPGVASSRRGGVPAHEMVVPGGSGPDGPTPDPAATGSVQRAAHDLGRLLLTYGNVIRLRPPLIITDDEPDRGLTLLEQAFATR
jgi:4-aminobutyrate aminotransferase/(S)-3-amino-2-methylpropionate transaminase